jgi:steroid 5-alpha reductase family enzyme
MEPAYWQLVAAGGLGIAGFMFALWLVELKQRDASAVDAGWAASLGSLAIYYALAGPGEPGRRILIGCLAGLWSFRLTGFLLLHRVIGREEDGRYQDLRAGWGPRAHPYFFVFYQAQGFLALVLSVPFLLICFNRSAVWHYLEIAAVVLWTVAMLGEAIADRQLASFRADPSSRGKTCRRGLWRYSRHPNYFFEWLIWCAYALLALPAPYGSLGIISPALILISILKVTGIPPTEEQALKSRGEDYREYQRTTSAFVPWFPKRTS